MAAGMTTHVMDFYFLKKDTDGFVNTIKSKYVNKMSLLNIHLF